MHGNKTVEQHITHLHLSTDTLQMLRICNVRWQENQSTGKDSESAVDW